MKKIFILLLIVVMAFAVFTGCEQDVNDPGDNTGTEKDTNEDNSSNDDNPNAGDENNQENMTVDWKAVLYLPGPQRMNLFMEERDMKYIKKDKSAGDLDVAKKALFCIEELINSGETSIPENTTVLSVETNGDNVILNLSEDFVKDHVGGSTGIDMTMGPIVLTLTELEGVNSVSFKIEGRTVEDFKGHIMFNRPFTRDEYTRLIK